MKIRFDSILLISLIIILSGCSKIANPANATIAPTQFPSDALTPIPTAPTPIPTVTPTHTATISPTLLSHIDVKDSSIPFYGFNPMTTKSQIVDIFGNKYKDAVSGPVYHSIEYGGYSYFGLVGNYSFEYDDNGAILNAYWSSDDFEKNEEEVKSWLKIEEEIRNELVEKYSDFHTSSNQDVAHATAYNYTDEYSNNYTVFIYSVHSDFWNVTIHVFSTKRK